MMRRYVLLRGGLVLMASEYWLGRWEVRGAVFGRCGHRHLSKSAAKQCKEVCRRRVESAGGVFDGVVYELSSTESVYGCTRWYKK